LCGASIRKGPGRGAKRQQSAKKILNRGNEPKNLLKTKRLAFLEAKNKPKTNSILSAKSANQSEKTGIRIQEQNEQVTGAGAWRQKGRGKE
jgi:hypothetical protein